MRRVLFAVLALCSMLPAQTTGDYFVYQWDGTKFVKVYTTTFPSAAHTHSFSSLTSKPTTLSGYGISDAITAAAAASTYALLSHTQAWSTITSTPTTLAGYGISDAITAAAAAAAYQPLSGNLTSWAGKTPYVGTLAISSGKTLTASNTLTLTGTDGSTLAIGAGGTLASMAYQSASAVAITGGTITGVEIEEMAAYKLASTFAADTLGPAEYGLGFADEHFTIQSPVGALQFYETGSPLESVMYWPGRLVVGTMESTSITGSIVGSQVASGSLPGSVMRDSMTKPMQTWQDSATHAGANGLTYSNTGPLSSSEPATPGNYFAIIEVTDGGVDSANALEGKIKTHSQMAVPRIVAVPATATSTGTTGDVAFDASYLYHCTATNTWRRVAHSLW